MFRRASFRKTEPMVKRAEEWFPLYPGHYHRDTGDLTTEQHGAYFLLLMACWSRAGRLPNDDARLASIAKLTPAAWKKHAPILREFFENEGDTLAHKRVLQEYEKAQEMSRRAQENGAKGGRPRKLDGTQKKPKGLSQHNLDKTPPPPPDRVKGPTGHLTPIPQGVFSNSDFRAKAFERMGPDWVASYLDPAEWRDIPEKLIVARNGTAADRIRRELHPLLRGIKVISAQELAA
jgi:uncharacterized protein YdaU (DUF1376 family)